MNSIFRDELGQISAEELSLYDKISFTTFMGGILIIGTLDHLQIQPMEDLF